MGISSGSKSKKMVNGIIYHCAKFGAFFTKRIIPPKKLAMPRHYSDCSTSHIKLKKDVKMFSNIV